MFNVIYTRPGYDFNVVLCNDGLFHNENMVGGWHYGKKLAAKVYKRKSAAEKMVASVAHSVDAKIVEV